MLLSSSPNLNLNVICSLKCKRPVATLENKIYASNLLVFVLWLHLNWYPSRNSVWKNEFVKNLCLAGWCKKGCRLVSGWHFRALQFVDRFTLNFSANWILLIPSINCVAIEVYRVSAWCNFLEKYGTFLQEKFKNMKSNANCITRSF